jgi:hypothetical protein
VVLLQQQRSQERPKHGLSMAVALVQPQVGLLAKHFNNADTAWLILWPNMFSNRSFKTHFA